MSSYEIGKDVANLQQEVKELRSTVERLIGAAERIRGRRAIRERDGVEFIEGFSGEELGLNSDGKYIWETESPVKEVERGAEAEAICDFPLRRASYGGGIGRGICQLEMESPVSESVGTGALISKRLVLTSAHCLYDEGRYVAAVKVSPGRRKSGDTVINPYGTYRAEVVRVHSAYRTRQDTDYDIGIVILPNEAIWQATNFYWGIEASDWRAGFRDRYVFGYPGSGDGIDVGWMYQSFGEVTPVSENSVEYRMSSLGGMSGGPLLKTGVESSMIHGVHRGGTCPNDAVRINATNLRLIHAWIDQYDP